MRGVLVGVVLGIVVLGLGVWYYGKILTPRPSQNISIPQNITPSQNLTPQNVAQKPSQNITEARNVTKEKNVTVSNVTVQNISRWWAGAIAFQDWEFKDIYFLFPNGTITKLPLPAYGGFSVTHNGTIAYTELIDSEGKPTQDSSKAVGSKIVVFSLIENKSLFTISPGKWNAFPLWTPWGDLVFASSETLPVQGIYILKKNGTLVRWIKTSFPHWSPDGKYIAFQEGNNIRIVDSSLNTVLVTEGIKPDWSPDGKFLVCIVSGGNGIKLIDIENKKEKTIFTGYADSPAVSLDGKYVVFVEYKEHKIFRINIDGSDLKELVSLSFSPNMLQFVPP
jgi:WD40 repeat protein